MRYKPLMLIFVFIFALNIVSAEVWDKTDFKNLSSPQEYQGWLWSNITAFVRADMNITTIGYAWSCSYTGEATLPSCWTTLNFPQINSTLTPFHKNKIMLPYAGSDIGVSYTTTSSKHILCGYRQQSSGGNAWFELDNGVCAGNFLGYAKEDLNNRGAKNGNCGNFNSVFPSINNTEYVAICIDSILGQAYMSNGSNINTFTATADQTYVKMNFVTGGGNGSLGYFRGYDPVNSAQNSSAITWAKAIRINAPNSTFNLTWMLSDGDITNLTAFISCNNGTTYNATTNNGTGITCIGNQMSQDIIYGFNTSASNNVTAIFLNTLAPPPPPPPDTTAPIVNITRNSSIKLNDLLNVSCYSTDTDGILSSGNITFNWTAQKNFSFALSGTTSWYSQNVTNNFSNGYTINITCWAKNGVGNVTQNSTLLTIENTLPSAPIIISPTANDYNATIPFPFNITFANPDADGDTITDIKWYINGILNQTTGIGNTTFNASDGYYILNVSVFDGFNWSANATQNFTIDTTVPTLTIFNVSNNTVVGYSNITLNIVMTDTNPYNLTIRLWNASNDAIFTATNSTTYAGENTLRLTISLNTSILGTGNYTLDLNFSDTHTLKKIEDYGIGKSSGIGTKSLNYVTDEDNNYFKIDLVASDLSIQEGIKGINDFGTYKKEDRYVFYYDFTKNATDKKEMHNYTFRLISQEPLKRINDSGYEGHFITSHNWIDFVLQKGSAAYTYTKISEYEWEIKIETTETNLVFKSIGGLNVVNQFYIFTVDNQPPFFPANSSNLTRVSIGDVVGISFNCSDLLAISTCIIGHNQSGIWVNVTNSTIPNNSTQSLNYTYNLSITASQGTVIGVMAFANDTFNRFAGSEALTLTVNDTALPIINGSLNSTKFYLNGTYNVSFNASDNFQLDSGRITINESGHARYFNFTLNGVMNVNFSQNFTVREDAGATIFIIGWVNDTNGNTRENKTSITITKNLNIVSRNIFDNTSISNFTVTLFNSTTTIASNSTISSKNITFADIIIGAYSINISSDTENGGYHNRTININVTNTTYSFEADLFQAIVYVFGKRKGTDVNVTDWNISVSNGKATNFSNSTGGLRVYLNASNYVTSLTAGSSRYFQTFSYLNLTNKSTTTSYALFYDINLSIQIFSVVNNSAIYNFTVFLNSNYTDFSENNTDTKYGNATGNASFSLGNNTYLITIQAPSFALYLTRITLLSNDTYPNLTFYLYGLNAINFSIYDEFTYTLLLNNVSISLIGENDNLPRNTTIDNGLFYTESLSPQRYRISHSKLNYPLRDYYFTVYNGTNSSIKLFSLSSGNSTNIVFTVQDENSKVVSNATIKMLRYFSQSSSYETAAMALTDVNGQGRINVEFFNAFYQFVVDKNNRTILISNPSRIIDTAITLNTLIGTDIFRSIKDMPNVAHELTFNNDTQQFRFVYDDPVGIVQSACLIVERVDAMREVEVCNTCSTSSASTIICSINTTQDGYHKAFGRFETVTSTSLYFTEFMTVIGEKLKQSTLRFGQFGVYLASYLIMALALIGLPYPFVSISLASIGFIFSAIMGILAIEHYAIVTIILIGAIIMYKTRS